MAKRGSGVALLLLFLFSSAAAGGELEVRKEIIERVERLFMAEQFDELERLANEYRENESRTPSGIWKLSSFYYGFEQVASISNKNEAFWSDLLFRVNKWIDKNPDSAAAHITKGIILSNYAWNFRGGGWAKDVPEDAWKPFRENLRIADKYMKEVKGVASVDPHWYTVRVENLTALSTGEDELLSFVREGLARYPLYYQLYFEAIDYLAPKWHGDKEKIEKFANRAVKRTREHEGMGMYARIYWYAWQTQYTDDLFARSDVVWAKMKKGIFDVIDQYPAQWNIQFFSFISCVSGDKQTTRKLMKRINKPIIEAAWYEKDNFDICREFAFE